MDVSRLLQVRTEPIEIEEYKDLGPFTVRTLTGADRSRIVAAYAEDKSLDKVDAVALMIAIGFGDKNGDRIFSDERVKDVKALPVRVTDVLAKAIRTFNYLTQEAVDAAKKG